MASRGTWMGSTCVVIAIMASTASAQTSAGWRSFDDERPTHTATSRMRPAEAATIAGATVLAVGYAAAAAWGGYYLASLHLGVLSCNDTYGGWHFLPVIGPVLGMGLGGACVPDALHFEEAAFPVVLSVVQLAGLVMTIVGLTVQLEHPTPRIAIAIDPNGGFATLGWSF